jgi:hypothetical protein
MHNTSGPFIYLKPPLKKGENNAPPEPISHALPPPPKMTPQKMTPRTFEPIFGENPSEFHLDPVEFHSKRSLRRMPLENISKDSDLEDPVECIEISHKSAKPKRFLPGIEPRSNFRLMNGWVCFL